MGFHDTLLLEKLIGKIVLKIICEFNMSELKVSQKLQQ